MGDFLQLNYTNVPVADNEWVAEPEYTSEPARRIASGAVSDNVRFERGVWKAKTPILTPAEVEAYSGILNGSFDLYNYEDPSLLSSQRSLVPRGDLTSSAVAPAVEARNGVVSSGGTAVLPSALDTCDEFAVFTFKKDASGSYTSWTHVGYRSSDGATYEDGVLNGSADASNWLARNGANLHLLGKNAAGTNAQAEYDHTVICWFTPTDEMMAAWSDPDYIFPTLDLPIMKMTGDGIKYREPETYWVRCIITEIEYVEAVIGGVFYENAATIEFEIHEQQRSYLPSDIFLAGSSAGQSGIAAAFTSESGFTTPTPPGAPFADYNAQSLATGNVTTWANEGSDATGDLSSWGGHTAPTCITPGSGSPVTGAKFLEFSGSPCTLQGTFTTPRTDFVFACVVRVHDRVAAVRTLFDSSDTSNAGKFGTHNATAGNDYSWYVSRSTNVSNGAAHEYGPGKWVRVVGRFGASSAGRVIVERVVRASGTTGTATNNGLTLGCNSTGLSGYLNMDLARLTMWDDGTTLAEAEAWLEEAYPFESIPPGNPIHWYDPNDYAVGSVATIVDKGSKATDLTCTDVTVELDASANGCGEQKVFNFNGSTSKAIDSSYINQAQPVLCACHARAEDDSTTKYLVGRSPTSANSARMLWGAGNEIRLAAQTTAIGTDADTLAPFNTRQRWAHLGGVFNSASSITNLDGTEVTALNTASDGFRSMALGADYNGVSYGTSYFNGKMSDVVCYAGVEAIQKRLGEIEEWIQKHRRLATLPGAPFVDCDAMSFSGFSDGDNAGPWTNDGSEGDLAVSGPNVKLRYDGPELGVGTLTSKVCDQSVEYLSDVNSNVYHQSSATFTAKTQPVTALSVFKIMVAATSADMVLGDTDTGATACSVRVSANTRYPRINGGVQLQQTVALPTLTWHWIAAEFNSTTSHVSDSQGSNASGDAGTESHGTKHRIGDVAAGNSDGDHRQARHIYWNDGTTWEQAEEYAKRRYPNVDAYYPY